MSATQRDDDVTTSRLRRAKTRLDVAGLSINLAAATFLGALVVGRWEGWQAVAAGVAAGAVAAAWMLWTRHRFPPVVESPSQDPAHASLRVGDTDERDEEAGAGHDVVWALITGVAVAGFVLVALTIRFMLPLAVIGAFWLADPDGTSWAALLAAACFLVLMAGYEFGVEAPLHRRWGLPTDAPARPRSDFCPTPLPDD